MYAQSNVRRVTVATVLVATLAGLMSAGLDTGRGAGTIGAVPAGGATVEVPVMLPEIVVTASRLEA